MNDPDEEYNRLEDQMHAIKRERDALQRQVLELSVRLENAENYGECCDNIIVRFMPDWKEGL